MGLRVIDEEWLLMKDAVKEKKESSGNDNNLFLFETWIIYLESWYVSLNPVFWKYVELYSLFWCIKDVSKILPHWNVFFK